MAWRQDEVNLVILEQCDRNSCTFTWQPLLSGIVIFGIREPSPLCIFPSLCSPYWDDRNVLPNEIILACIVAFYRTPVRSRSLVLPIVTASMLLRALSRRCCNLIFWMQRFPLYIQLTLTPVSNESPSSSFSWKEHRSLSWLFVCAFEEEIVALLADDVLEILATVVSR